MKDFMIYDTYQDRSTISVEDGNVWFEFSGFAKAACYTPEQAREVAKALNAFADAAEAK